MRMNEEIAKIVNMLAWLSVAEAVIVISVHGKEVIQ